MLVKVLKPFRFSENGLTSIRLEPSADPDHRDEVPDHLCAGLAGEGFIDGAEHGLPLLSPARRSALIDAIVADGRVELAKLPDERLIALAERNRLAAVEDDGEEELVLTHEDAEDMLNGTGAEPVVETKVIEAAPETSTPAAIEGASTETATGAEGETSASGGAGPETIQGGEGADVVETHPPGDADADGQAHEKRSKADLREKIIAAGGTFGAKDTVSDLEANLAKLLAGA